MTRGCTRSSMRCSSRCRRCTAMSAVAPSARKPERALLRGALDELVHEPAEHRLLEQGAQVKMAAGSRSARSISRKPCRPHGHWSLP